MKACIFTNSPDEHFILDRLPDAPQVSVAVACSGHGYKFCSVVGEIMADLATDGATRHDIGFLPARALRPGGRRRASRGRLVSRRGFVVH